MNVQDIRSVSADFVGKIRGRGTDAFCFGIRERAVLRTLTATSLASGHQGPSTPLSSLSSDRSYWPLTGSVKKRPARPFSSFGSLRSALEVEVHCEVKNKNKNREGRAKIS
ncbi:hypothetical protein PoB_001227200 [Plakobranchus ocellatus]|uniref:Uncharacterized protein n=1 Tax=Plakobranchus ocellatus TaxID=259542 RepID=A0AAV3YTG6_9GAST|nr:hypothetical protein PoB_001227200 [Plakobranchus ocellatus]